MRGAHHVHKCKWRMRGWFCDWYQNSDSNANLHTYWGGHVLTLCTYLSCVLNALSFFHPSADSSGGLPSNSPFSTTEPSPCHPLMSFLSWANDNIFSWCWITFVDDSIEHFCVHIEHLFHRITYLSGRAGFDHLSLSQSNLQTHSSLYADTPHVAGYYESPRLSTTLSKDILKASGIIILYPMRCVT